MSCLREQRSYYGPRFGRARSGRAIAVRRNPRSARLDWEHERRHPVGTGPDVPAQAGTCRLQPQQVLVHARPADHVLRRRRLRLRRTGTGPQGPLFAATSSLIALGFPRDPRLRKVIEVAHRLHLRHRGRRPAAALAGPGIWQAALVLLFSILLARFLDSGSIFTTQLGAAVGAGGAAARAARRALHPQHRRRRGRSVRAAGDHPDSQGSAAEPRNDVKKLLHELAEVLRECASALATATPPRPGTPSSGRADCQPLVDAMRAVPPRPPVRWPRWPPPTGGTGTKLDQMEQSLDYIDLALRNSRVFARRLTSAINHAALSDEATQNIADVLQETADAVDELSPGPGGSARRRPPRATCGRHGRPAARSPAGCTRGMLDVSGWRAKRWSCCSAR